MRRYSVVTAMTLILAGISLRVHADVWKWVDAQGQVQYSDRWVPGAQLIKGDRTHERADTPSSSDNQKSVGAMNERSAQQLAEQNAAAAVHQDVAAVRAEQCKQAKDRYDKMIEARRIYRTGKDGEREYMSDEEADQQRLHARMDMQQACGTSAAK